MSDLTRKDFVRGALVLGTAGALVPTRKLLRIPAAKRAQGFSPANLGMVTLRHEYVVEGGYDHALEWLERNKEAVRLFVPAEAVLYAVDFDTVSFRWMIVFAHPGLPKRYPGEAVAIVADI